MRRSSSFLRLRDNRKRFAKTAALGHEPQLVVFGSRRTVRSISSYLADACRKRDLDATLTMFKALRIQMDELGIVPD